MLTGGRFRLGLGIGWNPVEYEALGMNFHDRGRRLEEQIELMRRLWTEPVIDFEGRWHKVTAAGLNPLPVQRPIPIWIGGSAERALRRTALLADGYFPQRPLEGGWPATMQRMRGWVEEAGRDWASFGVEQRINVADGTPDDWRQAAEEWRELGATHLSLVTTGGGLEGPGSARRPATRGEGGARVIVPEDIERYAEEHTTPPDPLLAELEAETRATLSLPEMLAGPRPGAVSGVSRRTASVPKRVLEIGTYSGYSALAMAAGLPPDGRIDTCEIDEERAEVARRYIARSAYADRITVHLGPAHRDDRAPRRRLRLRLHRRRQGRATSTTTRRCCRGSPSVV